MSKNRPCVVGTKKGHRCPNDAAPNSKFCPGHNPKGSPSQRKRARQEAYWRSKNGPVTSRIDPSIVRSATDYKDDQGDDA